MSQEQFRHITLQQLEALVHIVEERSFSRAAERMHLTQPSLSKHIRNLEIFTDTRLLERGAGTITLTEEGRLLHAYARQMLSLRDEARERIVGRNALAEVTLAASTIPATHLLPSVMTEFRRAHAEVCFHVRTADSAEVVEMILAGTAEMGLIGREAPDRRLADAPLWEDEIILVAPPDHPWSTDGVLPLDELVTTPLVERERGSATRGIVEEHLAATMPTAGLVTAAEMGSSEALKQAVLAGLAPGFISRHAVRRELDAGLLRAVSLEGPPIRRRIHLIHLRNFSPDRCTAEFIKFLKDIPSH